MKDPLNPVVAVDADVGIINGPITREGILIAVGNFRHEKAPGPDGIIRHLKENVLGIAVYFFCKLFNEIFDRGIYPENWTKSIIQPLFKKGNRNHPSNYRGIMLSDISGN